MNILYLIDLILIYLLVQGRSERMERMMIMFAMERYHSWSDILSITLAMVEATFLLIACIESWIFFG